LEDGTIQYQDLEPYNQAEIDQFLKEGSLRSTNCSFKINETTIENVPAVYNTPRFLDR
jgi:hypothetical protein